MRRLVRCRVGPSWSYALGNLIGARAGSLEPRVEIRPVFRRPRALAPAVLRLAHHAQRLVQGLLARLRRLEVLRLELQEDLPAEDRDVARRLDPQADLLSEHREHRHLDGVADHDALVGLAGEHQHPGGLLAPLRGSGESTSALALVCPVAPLLAMNRRGGRMLYGRRLDQSLQHVDGSRYALVHAVAKRARQITLWLTADPAELRAEAAPPPAPGELTSRDPVALAEAEILDGEVKVRWNPEGTPDEAALIELDDIET